MTTAKDLLLAAENEKMREALKEIIEQCPNPKLAYGISVVEIARNALTAKEGEG